jgi:hypothetical protein
MNPSSSSKPGIPPRPTQSAAEKMDALAKADSFSEQPVRAAVAALAPAESTQDAPGATPPAESAAKGKQSPSGPASPSRADKSKNYPWNTGCTGAPVSFSTRIPDTLHAKMKFVALLTSTKIGDLATEALTEKIERVLLERGIRS